MNTWLLVAAVLSAGICWLHTFVGGRRIARPLLTAPLPSKPKHTSYFCWHIVTLVLAALGIMFLYAAVQPEGVDVAWVAVGLTASIAVYGIVMPPSLRLKYTDHPQGWLFVPVAIVGAWGCLS
ncbi:hypothetical protein [Oceanicaulis sp. MMSF_3324]|uniref:hypothetical protein n=1 Tax=Oceanicaulis sp. MMSF_3324 TaxID=3046702 RepID=UPI00273F8EC6|nr:hypothetical protein [Oceanicaulis sp. MMSF_3324]